MNEIRFDEFRTHKLWQMPYTGTSFKFTTHYNFRLSVVPSAAPSFSLSLCLSLLVSYASLRIYTGFSLEMRGKKSWRDKCPESCAWLFMLLLLLLEFVSLSAYIIIQHNWLLLLLWLLNYSFHAAYTTDLKPEWAVSVWDMRKTTENPWWLDPWQIWYGGLLNNLAHDANFIIISSELCDVDDY